MNSASGTEKEFPTLIASMPASAKQRQIALGVVVVLSVVFGLLMPFARAQSGRVDAFIPVVQTVLCFADLTTAVFLFAQFSIQPQRALLALASGYIFSGLFAFLQTLDFPGAYSATGLLSGGPSGAAWLFCLWHIAFPLAVVAYVLLKDADETARLPVAFQPRITIAVTVGCVLVVTAGLTWVVAKDYLPSTFFDLMRMTPFVQYLVGTMWVLYVAALLLLFIRMRTVLDLWLAVTLFASLPDLALSFLYPVVRFSVGWYVARSYALIASYTVLVVLLVETTWLYTRLASAILAEEIRKLYMRLANVEDDERRVLHAKLHDQVGANLSALRLELDVTATLLSRNDSPSAQRHLSSAREVASETIAMARNLMAELRPPALDDYGLLAGLRTFGESQSSRLNLPIQVGGEDLAPRPSALVEGALYRIAQEAVINAARHASATRVTVAVGERDGQVILTVEDDGTGFDPDAPEKGPDHWGLRNMRERVRAIGGTLRIETAPGAGTRITAEAPREAPHEDPGAAHR